MVRKEILISLLQGWWRWCVKRSSYHCYRYGERDPHIIVTGMVEVVRKEILISLLQVWWRWCVKRCVKRSSYHCYRDGGGGA